MIPPTLPTKRILKRIAPLQLGKILGLVYGALGLLVVPFFLFMAITTAAMPAGQRGVFAFVGIGMALCAPLFYAAMGFVFGILGAWIYNLIAGWIGGVEFEVE